MQVVLYTKIIHKVSGVQTFEKGFIMALHKFANIKYVYDACEDPKIIEELGQYCEVVKNSRQIIRCDVCVYSSMSKNSHFIQADKYIQVAHSEFSKWKLEPESGVDYVAVSKTVADDLMSSFGVSSIVIPNLLPPSNIQTVLRLLTASRIDTGKGFERMVEFAKKLKGENRRFVWEVYGDGPKVHKFAYQEMFKDIPEVSFMGIRDNIPSYMKGVDYVVQLSDSEGFCYSVYEALSVGTPVIVNSWAGVENVIQNGYNGYILNDILDLDLIYSKKPKIPPTTFVENADNWLSLFNKK